MNFKAHFFQIQQANKKDSLQNGASGRYLEEK